jgi:phosphoenolpyruvate-protein phosphotransferase (PTS system enzyme I)
MDKATHKRKVIKGTPISGGIALGTVRIIQTNAFEVSESTVPSNRVQAETTALDSAIADTVADLKKLRDDAGTKLAGPIAKIFDAQLLIASDYEFLKQVRNEITTRRRNAAWAYCTMVQKTTDPLKQSPDTYMSQMALDIDAVAQRVLSHLKGVGARAESRMAANTILVGSLFSPGDVLAFRQRKVAGLVAAEAAMTSHMALIARALMVPLVQFPHAPTEIPDSARIIINGTSGEIIVNPSEKEWGEYQKRKRVDGPALITRIKKLNTFPPKTRDGKAVGIGANLTIPGLVDDILSEKRIPIGLYRTEFLYLQNNGFPDEESQFETYQTIAKRFAPAEVTIRVFDLGYDKFHFAGDWPHEDNPALGWRGIRPLLDMTDVFKAQIRAILRASTKKNLSILMPMVADMREIDKAKRLISQVKFKLKKEGVAFDENIKLGIMIEVPSAALLADQLAPHVDFMSIGTNDLTQYTLAADRLNRHLSDLYSHFHPAVLKLVQLTVTACKSHKKPVSLCGELAGELLALPLFIGMGVDLLSMSPNRVFDACRLVAKIDSGIARRLSDSVLAESSLDGVMRQLQGFREHLDKR